jgi:hypothetical protein
VAILPHAHAGPPGHQDAALRRTLLADSQPPEEECGSHRLRASAGATEQHHPRAAPAAGTSLEETDTDIQAKAERHIGASATGQILLPIMPRTHSVPRSCSPREIDTATREDRFFEILNGSPVATARRKERSPQPISTVSQLVAVSSGSMVHVSVPGPPFTTSADVCWGTSTEEIRSSPGPPR